MKLRNKKTGKDVILRNKKTGEIASDYNIWFDSWFSFTLYCGGKSYLYETSEQFKAEWEEYEEPGVCYFIDPAFKCGYCQTTTELCPDLVKRAKELGIGFETEEEAKKAVEKLRAWKRLKENGFEFTGWKRDEKYYGDFTIDATDQTSCDDKDLDLLFNEREYLRKEIQKIVEKNADYYDKFGGEE